MWSPPHVCLSSTVIAHFSNGRVISFFFYKRPTLITVLANKSEEDFCSYEKKAKSKNQHAAFVFQEAIIETVHAPTIKSDPVLMLVLVQVLYVIWYDSVGEIFWS